MEIKCLNFEHFTQKRSYLSADNLLNATSMVSMTILTSPVVATKKLYKENSISVYSFLALSYIIALATLAALIDKNSKSEQDRTFEKASQESSINSSALSYLDSLKLVSEDERERFIELANNILEKILQEVNNEKLSKIKLIIDEDFYNIASTDFNNEIRVSEVCSKLFNNDPDILAFILSHEVSHLIHRHNIDNAVVTFISNIIFISGVNLTFLLNFLPLTLKLIFGIGISFLTSINLIYYASRVREIKADNSALYLMTLSGYNPESSKKFLKIAEHYQLELFKEARKNLQDPNNYYINYFFEPLEFLFGSTHPDNVTRMNNFNYQIEEISKLKELKKPCTNYKWPSLEDYLKLREVNKLISIVPSSHLNFL